jgi:hypothetical protein
VPIAAAPPNKERLDKDSNCLDFVVMMYPNNQWSETFSTKQ